MGDEKRGEKGGNQGKEGVRQSSGDIMSVLDACVWGERGEGGIESLSLLAGYAKQGLRLSRPLVAGVDGDLIMALSLLVLEPLGE